MLEHAGVCDRTRGTSAVRRARHAFACRVFALQMTNQELRDEGVRSKLDPAAGGVASRPCAMLGRQQCARSGRGCRQLGITSPAARSVAESTKTSERALRWEGQPSGQRRSSAMPLREQCSTTLRSVYSPAELESELAPTEASDALPAAAAQGPSRPAEPSLPLAEQAPTELRPATDDVEPSTRPYRRAPQRRADATSAGATRSDDGEVGRLALSLGATCLESDEVPLLAAAGLVSFALMGLFTAAALFWL